MKSFLQFFFFLGDPEKYYNNNMESINKLLKHWQNYKKLDYYKFVQDYEEWLEEQERNVLRAFLNLDSPFQVRSDFSHHKLNSTAQFVILEPSKKEDVKNNPLNVLVDQTVMLMLLVIMLTSKQLTMREKT